MTKKELKANLSDEFWRLNHLYWITTKKGQRVLFKMNRVQIMLYKALWWLNIILKSRQHGITTFVCIMMLDKVLFNSNTKGGIIAHTLQAAQEIFRDKIKYPYDNLPKSIKALLPTLKCDAGQLVLANNSSIMVATSLRSGTYQWVHVSEYGKICAKTPQRAIEIQTGTLETVHEGGFVTIESTAEGRVGDFFDRCIEAMRLRDKGKELGRMDYKFHFFGWWLDDDNTTDPKYVDIPEKVSEYLNKLVKGLDITLTAGQRAWYAMKKKSLKLTVYREQASFPDEAFKASVEGSYFGTEIAIARESGRICELAWEKHAPVHTFWDIGHKHTAIWFAQFCQGQKRLIDYYYDNAGLGLAQYKKMLDLRPYNYGEHWGPWDIAKGQVNSRSAQTGRDLVDVARDVGIMFKTVDKNSVELQIKATIDAFNSCWFGPLCDEGIVCLEMFRPKWDENLGTFGKTYLPDKYAHGATAFMVMIQAWKYQEIGNEYLGDTEPDTVIVGSAGRSVEELLNV